jgi:hypothetical protein
VIVKASSQTTADTHYAIKSDSKSTMGQLLCLTGRTTGTHCAEVSDLGADESTLGPNGQVFVLHNMGELDSCVTQPGDSGGPLYKTHKAYGIYSAGVNAAFQCVEAYQGIRGAEKALNADLVLAP